MALILSFLGKGGTGRTTIAIAAAKQLASQGKRVLLASLGSGPAFDILTGISVTPEPTQLAPNIDVVQFQTTLLLQKGWEEVKKVEAEYVRTPFFKEVYGEELTLIPGMDGALALNELRQYEADGKYDVLIYDGPSDLDTLRMLELAESLSWYGRRFRQVLEGSDIIKALSPFWGPVSSAILNVDWSPDSWTRDKNANKVTQMLDDGKAALADPSRIAAYLVTTDDPAAIATARYRWGCAQQVGLTVGGAIVNRSTTVGDLLPQFTPLDVSAVPTRVEEDWQPLMMAMPDFSEATKAPRPIEIDVSRGIVRLFLPGFTKQQVKLIQSGPEVTIEAGDRRRNIFLPPQLRGRPVTGAKFQDQYLTIAF
ncbi:MAG: ArsA family ATPase [Cyanobacteriota bacterium]|nr:ArsA family ATPase [Cyanobacteriota bacterium]